jgi:hypothetical protein
VVTAPPPARKRLVQVSLRASHLAHEADVFQLVKLNTHNNRDSEPNPKVGRKTAAQSVGFGGVGFERRIKRHRGVAQRIPMRKIVWGQRGGGSCQVAQNIGKQCMMKMHAH